MQQFIRKTCSCVSVALIAICIHSEASFAARESDKHPTLSAPTTLHDFGAVSEGAKVRFDFPLKNTGNADLLIQKVIPSCGCTNSRPSADIIPAGGAGSLMVEFDTTGFSGKKVKLVRMLTNDPHSPTVNFTIKGTVEDDIEINPKSFS